MKCEQRKRNNKASMTAEFGVGLALLSMFALLGANTFLSGMSALYVYLVTYDTSSKVAWATSRAEASRFAEDANAKLKREPLSKFFHASTDFEGGGVSVGYRTAKLPSEKKNNDDTALIFIVVKTQARVEPPLNLSGLAFAAKIPFLTTDAKLTYSVEAVLEHPECFK